MNNIVSIRKLKMAKARVAFARLKSSTTMPAMKM